jgi:formate dehydrogenase subunit delta
VHVRDIVRMANQITDFFAAYPKGEALDGIAKHIHASWEPRLRNTLKAHLDAGGAGLKPLCIEAMTEYFRGPKSPNARKVRPNRPGTPTGAEPSFADGGGDAG